MPQRNSVCFVVLGTANHIDRVYRSFCAGFFFFFGTEWLDFMALPLHACYHSTIYGRCAWLKSSVAVSVRRRCESNQSGREKQAPRACYNTKPTEAGTSDRARKKPWRGKNEPPVRPPFCVVLCCVVLCLCGRNSAIMSFVEDRGFVLDVIIVI